MKEQRREREGKGENGKGSEELKGGRGIHPSILWGN